MTELTSLPAEVLQKHIAFLATSDAGKTYAAKTAIEDLLDAGARACIIDPKGAWYGLRLMPDGRKASPYQLVIFGGDHADVPLEGVSGARLAQVIAAGHFSSIIDTRRLTVGQRTRLFADFAEGLSQHNSRPLHLVIDEAHLFAPQGRVNDFDSGRMVHAANELVSGGRSLGLMVMLLSQRPAKLHKDSLSQVQTLVAMMNMSPLDRKAVADWIKDQADPVEGKRILAKLPSLPVGHGFVWSPRIGLLEEIHFRKLRTYDSSASPAAGAPLRPTAPLAALDLKALRQALAPPPEVAPPPAPSRAAAARKDVAVFSAEADQLQEDFAAKLTGQFELGRQAGYTKGFNDGRASEWERAQAAFSEAVDNRLAGLRAFLAQDLVDARPADAPEPDLAREPASTIDAGDHGAREPAPKPKIPREVGAPGGLAMRLLDAALQSPRKELALQEMAVLAMVSGQSGPFHKAKGELLAAGLLLPGDRPGYVRALDWTGTGQVLRAGDVTAEWSAKLGGMAGRFLRHLFVVGPRTKHQVAEDLEVSSQSGPFHGGWKKLRANGLITDVGDGDLQISKILQDLKAVRP